MSSLSGLSEAKGLSFLRCGVDYSSPGALIAPDVLAQPFELQDLAVVYEEVALVAVVFDVPLKDRTVGGFKHHVLKAEAVDDGCGRAGIPFGDVLSNALGLDHDDGCAGIESLLASAHQVADVLLALGCEFGFAGVTAGANL